MQLLDTVLLFGDDLVQLLVFGLEKLAFNLLGVRHNISIELLAKAAKGVVVVFSLQSVSVVIALILLPYLTLALLCRHLPSLLSASLHLRYQTAQLLYFQFLLVLLRDQLCCALFQIRYNLALFLALHLEILQIQLELALPVLELLNLLLQLLDVGCALCFVVFQHRHLLWLLFLSLLALHSFIVLATALSLGRLSELWILTVLFPVFQFVLEYWLREGYLLVV